MGKRKISQLGAYEASMYGPEAHVVEAEKRGTKSGMTLPLAAAVASIVVLGGILLTANVGMASPSSTPATNGVTTIPDAVDGFGIKVGSQDTTNSDTITISNYYSGGYTTKLDCTMNLEYVYCDGTPFTIAGLPAGEYTVHIVGSRGLQVNPVSFSWVIS